MPHMKRYCGIAAALSIASSLFSSTASGAELVSSQKIGFDIEYEDGFKETGVIKYEGWVESSCVTRGEASTPTHPIDTRRADWKADGWIQRDICIVSRSLGEKCDGVWTKIFRGQDGHITQAWNPLRGVWGHDTCGRRAADIERTKRQISDAVITSIPSVMKADLEEALDLLKAGGVKRVVRR